MPIASVLAVLGLDPWAELLVLLLAAVLAALAVHAAFAWVLRRLLRRRGQRLAELLAEHARAPGQATAVLLAACIVLFSVSRPAAAIGPMRHAAVLALIAALAWLAARLTRMIDLGVAELVGARDIEDVRLRSVRTRVRVVRRVVVVAVWVVAASVMLMTFPRAWQVGVSLLASAGIAGLVAGLAARPVLANLIAGVQIAITEPIRLGDAVTIDGRFGWVEEITATYVVLLTRERRRLIVPVTFFVEKMFENWTRVADGVGAAVVVTLPRTADLGRVREAVQRALGASPAWNHGNWTLEVEAVRPAEIDVRVTAGAAAGSGTAGALELQAAIRAAVVAAV